MNHVLFKNNKLLLNSIVSIVLLLSAGCSDSDAVKHTASNNNQESSETDKSSSGSETTNEDSGSSTDTIIPPSGGGSNTDQEGGENGDNGGNDKTDTGTQTEEETGTETTPPSEGGDTEIGQLSFRFNRTPPAKNVGERPINEEMVGRAYDISIYRQTEKGMIEDVTDLVTWTAVSETCGKEPCFKVTEDKKLRATDEGSFTLVASLQDVDSSVVRSSPEISFKATGKLDVCPTNRLDTTGSQCLRVVEETNSRNGKLMMYTEPPREVVMSQLGYEEDASTYNSGYAYAKIEKATGFRYALMTNHGYDPDANSDQNEVGDYGQHSRFCRDLKEMEFNGRNDWRRPFSHELQTLANNGTASNGQWPTNSAIKYSAANPKAGPEYAQVDITTGAMSWETLDVIAVPICVSGEPF